MIDLMIYWLFDSIIVYWCNYIMKALLKLAAVAAMLTFLICLFGGVLTAIVYCVTHYSYWVIPVVIFGGLFSMFASIGVISAIADKIYD